jgi:hypothetical protein
MEFAIGAIICVIVALLIIYSLSKDENNHGWDD